MKTIYRALGALALPAIVALSGCGGGSIVTYISPESATLSTRGVQAFSTTLTHTGDPQVLWSVQEGSSGGTITSAGVYTAPSVAGTYHVIATSAANASKTATATLTVQSGASTLTVN